MTAPLVRSWPGPEAGNEVIARIGALFESLGFDFAAGWLGLRLALQAPPDVFFCCAVCAGRPGGGNSNGL